MIILVVKIFFVVLLCILATSSYYLLLLLGPYHFVLYCAHLCMKCSLGISNFLEEISGFSHSFVFLYFFALIAEEGFLMSPSILWNSAFKWVYFSFFFSHCFLLLFFSQLFVRAPQTAILIFCISFSWGWSCSLSPVQCHKPPSIVHPALYQI